MAGGEGDREEGSAQGTAGSGGRGQRLQVASQRGRETKGGPLPSHNAIYLSTTHFSDFFLIFPYQRKGRRTVLRECLRLRKISLFSCKNASPLTLRRTRPFSNWSTQCKKQQQIFSISRQHCSFTPGSLSRTDGKNNKLDHFFPPKHGSN